MPFVDANHRQKPDTTIPGDRTYLEYKKLMRQWEQEPRWTTIDNMASKFISNKWRRAAWLAFLVFFALHGMNYEETKRRLNGDIDGK